MYVLLSCLFGDFVVLVEGWSWIFGSFLYCEVYFWCDWSECVVNEGLSVCKRWFGRVGLVCDFKGC